MEKKPNFRIMKNGYDRYAVDDEVHRLTQELNSTKQKLETYSKQVDIANEQLTNIKQRYQKLIDELSVKEKAADDISRLALKEANRIIDTAQNNADSIVKEALSTAKIILLEIARISSEANVMKEDMQMQLETLQESLEAFEIPATPNVEWLKNDEEQDTPK